MSEIPHPNPEAELSQVQAVDAVKHGEVFEKGVALATNLILPLISRNELIRDYDSPVSEPGELAFRSTTVLYSEDYNITANIMLAVQKELGQSDYAANWLPGDVNNDAPKGSPEFLRHFRVTVEFIKGKFQPDEFGQYGDWDYFHDPQDYSEEFAENLESHAGYFSLQATDTGAMELVAHYGEEFGSAAMQADGQAITEMASWLQNVEELKPDGSSVHLSAGTSSGQLP